MMLVMYLPQYILNTFKELLSSVFIFSKMLLDDNLTKFLKITEGCPVNELLI